MAGENSLYLHRCNQVEGKNWKVNKSTRQKNALEIVKFCSSFPRVQIWKAETLSQFNTWMMERHWVWIKMKTLYKNSIIYFFCSTMHVRAITMILVWEPLSCWAHPIVFLLFWSTHVRCVRLQNSESLWVLFVMPHHSLYRAYLKTTRKLHKHNEECICKTIYNWHENNGNRELA